VEPDHVIAIDPGKTTGFAYWYGSEVVADQEPDQVEFCTRLERYLEIRCPGVVVIERFVINVKTVGNSQAPWSLELIGVARYLAAKHNCEFVIQTPADAKRFMSDERLKNLGWWQKGKVHANDALRHLGLYLVTRKLMCVDVL